MDESGPPRWPVVKLEGDLDLESFERMRILVVRALRPYDVGVTLDITEIDFFGSSGVHLIAWLFREGLSIRLVGANQMVRRVMEMTGLAEHPLLEFD